MGAAAVRLANALNAIGMGAWSFFGTPIFGFGGFFKGRDFLLLKRGRRPIVPVYESFILATNRTIRFVHDQNHLAKRKKLYARMRTLLNEALPPHLNNEPAFSTPQDFQPTSRIVSGNAVLAINEPDLMEVGVDGTVIATPGVCADSAINAPERGLATSQAKAEQITESPAL